MGTQHLVISTQLSPGAPRWLHIPSTQDLTLGNPTEQRRRDFLNQQVSREEREPHHLSLCSGIPSTCLPGLLILSCHVVSFSSSLPPFLLTSSQPPSQLLSQTLPHSFLLLSSLSIACHSSIVLPSPQSFSDFWLFSCLLCISAPLPTLFSQYLHQSLPLVSLSHLSPSPLLFTNNKDSGFLAL